MYNFTESELLFIARATWEDNSDSNVKIMADDWGYTPQQIGGFISSIKQKGGCAEYHNKAAEEQSKEFGEENWKWSGQGFFFPRDEMQDYYCGGSKNPSII